MSEPSSSVLSKLERAALIGTRALSVVGLAALMVLAFLILANGLMRWLFNHPLAGVVDVGGLAIAIAVSCCIPVSLLEKSHITFRVIEAASPWLGRFLNALASIAMAAVIGLMAWEFFQFAQSLEASGESTYVFKLKIAPFWYAVDAILWLALAVQLVVVLVEIARLFGRVPPAARAAPH
jgi:TRAP-type C4-dicarboxylate transport system permease small subunit